jgi:hypothetical protein
MYVLKQHKEPHRADTTGHGVMLFVVLAVMYIFAS